MSETQMTLENTTDAMIASQVLTPMVLGLQALAVNGKQAHWNVRGENFVAIHELLDTIVGNAQASADQVAERIVALGLPVDARVGTVAARVSPRRRCHSSVARSWCDCVMGRDSHSNRAALPQHDRRNG